jgi:phage repressor protein C with HTH and peptisase S24 domain
MKGSVNQRLKEVIAFYGDTVNSFATRTGVAQRTLASMFDRNSEPTMTTLNKIVSALSGEISENWLRSGEGDMCVDGNATAVSTNEHTCTILYFPEVDASMGNVDFGEENNAPRHNTIEMVLPYFYNADFAINAYGDSMSPLIKDGQIVLLSKWQENYIEWGKVYLVCTRSHRTIKRLFPVENDDTRIKCVSENSECYPPFNINKEDIQKMYIVRGHISKDTL